MVLTTSAPNFCVFGAQSGKPHKGEAAFKAIVWKSDVVYVGETHDQDLDHQAQFEALKAIASGETLPEQAAAEAQKVLASIRTKMDGLEPGAGLPKAALRSCIMGKLGLR